MGPMGPPPTFGARMVVRHKPGIGLAVGVIGVLMFMVSLTSLDWTSEKGGELTLPDIKEMTKPTGADTELEFIAIYADWMWIVVLLMATAGVVFSTLFVPSSRAARIVIGFLTAGMLGIAVHAADEDGTFAPRVTGALVTILCAVIHGLALADLLADEGAPDPGIAVWVSAAGLLAILLGCVLGTRTEKHPAPTPVYR